VPAATPLPRGPSVLTLYTAADLLIGPGCPVCRYVSEVSDRHLAWFALEAHADAITITRLCASLCMCPRHTRQLMRQPGAATRLTAVYRYVMEAARDRLTGRAAPLARCPACEHDDAATHRALDTLLEGLTDSAVQERYRELGGLCIPHLRAAAAVRAQRRVISWLGETMSDTLNHCPAGLEWLAGMDHDPELRAALRQTIPATARPGSGACMACLAAARAERDHLAQMSGTSDSHGQQDRQPLLCADHLGDAARLAGRDGMRPLLMRQAANNVTSLPRVPALSAKGTAGSLTAWLRTARRLAGHPYDCGVCQVREDAARRAVGDLRAMLRLSPLVHERRDMLCVRHLLSLRATDPLAAQVTTRDAVKRGDTLIAELTEAFRKNTWAHRHEARGPEMSAWRRAAAFLDGDVFCGCPPHQI
jgi:hypothetical protein